ncbi:hypothetical protein HNP99_002189 [Flavobacterium sp. 28A]|uniref:hypothetical protein n=1 Tax=Flavobacterium sp. 28A TaxID=2735895 RepID=UPI00156F68BB|nr:hypothetical protein [Flavobacterium sp. 28A]NRT15829.1 hypothetical protein [Flavobacterium sp. 28A]
MRLFYTLILTFLCVFFSNAQKIGLQQLEYTCQLKSIETKSDFFMSKQFAKISNSQDSIVRFSKKIYINRIQDFDEETISILKESIIYSLEDPKKYANFKKMVERAYVRLQNVENNSENIIIYKKKKYTLILTETVVKQNSKLTTIYNFTIYNN